MRKLFTLALLAVALVAADVLARAWAESNLAQQAAAYYPPSTGSSAEVRPVPEGLLVACSVEDVPPALVQDAAAAAVQGRN